MLQCKKNRKVYITSSITARQKIHNHWQSLLGNQHRNVELQNDFNKYGYSNFKIKILLIIYYYKIIHYFIFI